MSMMNCVGRIPYRYGQDPDRDDSSVVRTQEAR